MKIPRDISGDDLITVLSQLGYSVTRQTGSHVRLTTNQNGEHHITIPLHSPLRIGTIASILADIATHFQISREDLLIRLFHS